MTYSDAFFEAMSGFTTTGASVITSIDNMSHGVHLWRALMQWIGGMGIILFYFGSNTYAEPLGRHADVQRRGDGYYT